MLKIKLSKIGKRTQPKFRLIVSEQSKDPWGNVKEYLGSYDPKTKKSEFEVEKIKAYLKNGVQVTDTVHNLFVTLGIIEAKKRNVTLITKERRVKMSADAAAAKAKADEEKIAAVAPAPEIVPVVPESTPEPVSEAPVEPVQQ